MQIPGVWLETMRNPSLYTDAQIELALTIAQFLNRGRFVLCEEPKR